MKTRFDIKVRNPHSTRGLRRDYDKQGKVRLNARKERIARREVGQ